MKRLVLPDHFESGATWGAGGRASKYRYRLFRTWREGPRALFCMLNPSTADEQVDDPTVRRCRGYAESWGCGGYEVVNLFALRSTDPRRLYDVADPVGPQNDRHILEAAREAAIVVCAWGTHGALRGRGESVRKLLVGAGVDVRCLRLTKDGHPSHPLYLPAALSPQPWATP